MPAPGNAYVEALMECSLTSHHHGHNPCGYEEFDCWKDESCRGSFFSHDSEPVPGNSFVEAAMLCHMTSSHGGHTNPCGGEEFGCWMHDDCRSIMYSHSDCGHDDHTCWTNYETTRQSNIAALAATPRGLYDTVDA